MDGGAAGSEVQRKGRPRRRRARPAATVEQPRQPSTLRPPNRKANTTPHSSQPSGGQARAKAGRGHRRRRGRTGRREQPRQPMASSERQREQGRRADRAQAQVCRRG
eukprot:148381-Pyramimonas_sp.AAC.1